MFVDGVADTPVEVVGDVSAVDVSAERAVEIDEIDELNVVAGS